MFCTKCGEEIPDGSKFCKFCGNKTLPREVPNNQPQQATVPSNNQSQSNNTPMIIGIAVAVVVCLAGGMYYFSSSSKQETAKGNTVRQSQGITQNNSGAAKQNHGSVEQYIGKKEQINNSITSLAADVNNHLKSNASFAGTNMLDGRATVIINNIGAARASLRDEANMPSNVKNALDAVFEGELGRVQGLYDGIMDSKRGGNYNAGFKRGGDAYDRWEAAENELAKVLK